MYNLLDLFSGIDSRRSDVICVSFDDGHTVETIDWNQFYGLSSSLSELLKKHGCRFGNIVGCLVESSQWIPSVIFGILSAEAAFTFIPNGQKLNSEEYFNKIRVQFILCDRFNIVNGDGFHLVEEFGPNPQKVSFLLYKREENTSWHSKCRLAYVISTSGTTGVPTTVHVTHDSIAPNIIHLRELFDVCDDDRIVLMSPLTFDPSLIDIFLALAARASILIVSESVKMRPDILMDSLIRHRITIMQCTPSLLLRFNANKLRLNLLTDSSFMRIVAIGGETCPSASVIQSMRGEGNKTKFYNLYGITEVSCWATYHLISEEELLRSNNRDISLGQPLMNTVLDVKSDDGQSIMNSKDGEGTLYIGSRLRICYLDDEKPEELLDELVVRNTGDLVKFDADGHLIFVGRADDLIKHNGKKFSLSKIAKSVSSVCSAATAIWYREKKSVILAYVPTMPSISSDMVRQCLMSGTTAELPVWVSAFPMFDLPLTKHGKVDKEKILMLYSREKETRRKRSSRDLLRTFLSSRWKELTGCEPGCSSNFIASGGDSIKAVQFHNEIEDQTGRQLPSLLDVILNGTYAEISVNVTSIDRKKATLICDESNDDEFVDIPGDIDDKSRQVCMHSVSRRGMYRKCTNCHLNVDIERGPRDRNVKFVVRWKYDLKKCVDSSPLLVSRSKSSSCCGNEHLRVFIGSHSGTFCCVDASNGFPFWQIHLADRIESSACISTCGHYVFVGCYDKCLYCLKTADGEIAWKYESDGEIKSSPCVHPHKRIVYFGSHDRHVYALNTESGNRLWRTKVGESSVFSSPVIGENGDTLYVATLDGFLAAISSITGLIVWKESIGKPLFSSPLFVIDVGIVFGCVDCYVYCYGFDGSMIWRHETGGPVFSSPFSIPSSSDAIVVGGHDHHLRCISSGSGKKFWTRRFGSAIYSTPHSDGRYVATCETSGDISLLSLDGHLLTSLGLNGEIFSSPVLADGAVFVGCRDNFLYRIDVEEIESLSDGLTQI